MLSFFFLKEKKSISTKLRARYVPKKLTQTGARIPSTCLN